MQKKSILISIIVLIVIVVGAAIIAAYIHSETHISITLPTPFRPGPQPLPSSNVLYVAPSMTGVDINRADEAVNLNIPNLLLPEFRWATSSPVTLGRNALYYDTDSYGSVSLDGQEWIAEFDGTAAGRRDAFYNYYLNLLTKSGWDQSVMVSKRRLVAVAGDGPFGGIWGYVGVKDGEVRVVILSANTSYARIGEEPGEHYCPCTAQFHVFISKIVPISTILP